MQTLESTPIVIPEGYLIKSVRLTKAGIAKVEELRANENDFFFGDNYYLYATVRLEDWVAEIEEAAATLEMAPACQFDDAKPIYFVEGVDYTVQMMSLEAYDLECLADDLNKLHEVMQEEMTRLGW
jgi:hypothetical protein